MMPQPATEIAMNLKSVRERIARAAARAGRGAADIQLIAVSKTFSADAVLQAVAAGQCSFGENRVQEAERKISALAHFKGLQWHLVGHLQSNKARLAVQLFEVIHSLDSLRLAERLSEAAEEAGRRVSVLIQVDLAREATKFGADTGEAREISDAARQLPGIRLDGLMILPPFFEDPEITRPYFVRLRELSDELESARPGCLGQRQLSMGMTHDFEVAIEEGATMIRIGTAVFGSRTHA
jgi:hypothetical protein